MLNLLAMESNDVRFVGIDHGMGGASRTMLAKIINDRASYQFVGSSIISCIREESKAPSLASLQKLLSMIKQEEIHIYGSRLNTMLETDSSSFEGSSFIPCIRENSTTTRDQASLQKDLLYMIMQEEIRVCNHLHGSRMISSTMRNKKVFIVLDDVDSDEQLTALAGHRKWFGPGSKVIITCRDSHLLRTHEVNDIYEVEQLQKDEALQLLSLSAFKKTHPRENYKDLSMVFVNYAQGLPSALKVLGSFLFGREIDAWKSARDQLEANPNKEIMDVLQISFDGLKYSQKELFLDMACFFGGQDIFSEMLLERFGHYHIDLDVLVEKSLISKSKCLGLGGGGIGIDIRYVWGFIH